MTQLLEDGSVEPLQALGRSDPFVVLVYGVSGVGKSVDAGYSFPQALFIAAPGALSSIRSVCGYSPTQVCLQSLQEVTEILAPASKKYRTVVIDDFSFMAEQTLAIVEKKFSGLQLWGALRNDVLEFRNTSRFAGVNVVLNSWEAPPKVKPNGSRVRGGPQLSGNLAEAFPAMCDAVFRAVHEPGRKPWPASYYCAPDPSYVMKDRFNVASIVHPAPMNLGELLRAGGHVIERHPNFPSQEQQVETISQLLSGFVKDDAQTVNEIFAKLLASGTSVAEAKWTMRDAVDRAVIRAAKQAASMQFFDTSSSLLG